MGSVYKYAEPRKQKGRYIYNRNRLHKVGWDKHKTNKHRARLDAMNDEINEMYPSIREELRQ